MTQSEFINHPSPLTDGRIQRSVLSVQQRESHYRSPVIKKCVFQTGRMNHLFVIQGVFLNAWVTHYKEITAFVVKSPRTFNSPTHSHSGNLQKNLVIILHLSTLL